MNPPPKKVAVVVTEYRRHSHADVIVGKILEGFNYDGKDFPRMKVASMFVDQVTPRDMSRDLAKKFEFTLFNRIEDAMTLGKNEVGVEGVLIIGEHGTYPTNERGQIEYPRRRFFEAVTQVLARHKKSIPIFSDKHLSTTWDNARWMYDRARELHLPFMAGSSIPLTWRRPALRIEQNTDLIEAVQIGYGGFEGYGFHALEGLQCFVERRRGGETGVRSVQCLTGDAMWNALDKGTIPRDVFEAGLKLVNSHAKVDMRTACAKSREGVGLILIEYRDGFKASVVIPNGWINEGDGGGFIFAGKIKGQADPIATHFYLQNLDPFGHFGYQVKAIDAMMQSGHPSYPVERTLLTTGILEAVMQSRAEKNRKVETPHLDIRYQPNNWPFATDPVPPAIQR